MPNSPEREDRRRMRANNSIAPLLPGPAPPALGLGVPGGGWAPAGMVAVAAGVALADFDHPAWPDADDALAVRLAPLDRRCCLSGIAAAASPPPAVQRPILP